MKAIATLLVGFSAAVATLIGCTYAFAQVHGSDVQFLAATSGAWQRVPWDHDLRIVAAYRDAEGNLGLWQSGKAHAPGAAAKSTVDDDWRWRLAPEEVRLVRDGPFRPQHSGFIADARGVPRDAECTCRAHCRCLVLGGGRELEVQRDGSTALRTDGAVAPGPFLPEHDPSSASAALLGERVVVAVRPRGATATGLFVARLEDKAFEKVASIPVASASLVATDATSVLAVGTSDADDSQILTPFRVNVADRSATPRAGLSLGPAGATSVALDRASNILVVKYQLHRRWETGTGRLALGLAIALSLAMILFGARSAWARRHLVIGASAGFALATLVLLLGGRG